MIGTGSLDINRGYKGGCLTLRMQILILGIFAVLVLLVIAYRIAIVEVNWQIVQAFPVDTESIRLCRHQIIVPSATWF